jgi:hypothetical protein
MKSASPIGAGGIEGQSYHRMLLLIYMRKPSNLGQAVLRGESKEDPGAGWPP